MTRLLVVGCLSAVLLAAQGLRQKIGIEIDGLGDAARSRPFVDHAKVHRPCTEIGASARVAVDGDGWPLADAQCVMFDVRAIPAWAPPIDDPAQFQVDWSGEWAISFEGQAEVSVLSGGARVEGLRYEPLANVSAGKLIVDAGTGLLQLAFRNTKRTAESSAGSGFRKLRLVRPGYAASSGQVFSNEFLRSFRPFQTLRYMDFTATNNVTPSANASDLLEWRDRHLITDATQQTLGRKAGAAWEYAVLLANQTGTDMWINVPVSASEDYIRQLARLIVKRLNAGLKIYIEHGNEVWNPLFANSYNFNRNAAMAEVAAGGSNLNSDGIAGSADVFGRRRHLQRLIETVKIFREEAGLSETAGDFDRWRVRGVYAWWTIFPDQYRTTLAWAKSNYGDLNQHVYAIANTHYYNVSRAAATDTPERLLEVMRASSDSGVNFDNQFRQIAADYGLRHTIYEGGPDVGGGSTTNVGNRILANRLAGMKDLVLHDMRTNWFERGGAEYMYFAHCGPCSRFGCWGALEDIVNFETPKWRALEEISGARPAPSVAGIVNGGSFLPRVAAGSFVSLLGANLASTTQEWSEAILDGRTLPTMLGGLEVRFNGKPGAVYFVRGDQANVIVPPDVAAGVANVEVSTVNGTWRGTVEVKAAAPGLFGFTRDGKFFPAALFSGTTTYVGLGRAARAGDLIELYATGLGATREMPPVNEAPGRAYPVADLSAVRVSVGGRAAEVLFAGVTLAGVYQVNVRVPQGVAVGDQALVLEVGGERAQEAFLSIGN